MSEAKNQSIKPDELTPEQRREVFYTGGLKAVVEVAGQKLVLGELALKDRGKIFQCFEDDINDMQKTVREYTKSQSPGLLGALFSFFKTLLGIPKKEKPAISIFKQFIEGLTANDVKLIMLCAEGRNNMKPAEIRSLIMNAPASEVQEAIKQALEINGIDTKKLMAERERVIPSSSARRTTTSTVGLRK